MAGTDLVLTILRDGTEGTITVTRAPSRFASPQRRRAFTAAVAAQSQDLRNTCRAMSEVLRDWNGLVDEVSRGADPVKAIESVPHDLKKIGVKLGVLVSSSREKARQLFSDTQAFVYFDELIARLGDTSKIGTDSLEDMRSLSHKEERMMAIGVRDFSCFSF
jgi:beta-phosphoglucomutase-like phosphatase (HAD superfamily)